MAAWSVIPVLMLTGWQVRPGSGTNKLARGFQNGPCQHQCPCVENAPQRAAASVCVQKVNHNCLLSFQVALQDQQVGLTQTPFILCVCVCVCVCEVCVCVCVCVLGVEIYIMFQHWEKH